MFISIFSIFLISLFMSLMTTALMCKVKYATKNNISQSGGIAIWFSFLFVSLVFLILKKHQFLFLKEITGIYICSTLIFVMGLIDDKRELSVLGKFTFQIIIALIIMTFGVRTQIAGIGLLGNIFVTLFWILGITNAFNHLDIADGLLAGSAFIISFSFFIFSIITNNFTIALILVVLAGSILGFFRYNFPFAKIYMGNSGSHFLGFILSVLAITISYATLERRIALLIPIIVLGFPIFDTIFVIWVRLLKHKPIWLKSNDHLALKLISMGFSKKKAVTYMFLLAFLFSISAIFILFSSNLVGFMILLLLFAICVSIIIKMKK